MYPETGLEAQLRSHIQFLKNATFIFSGSIQHLMEEMFLPAQRPFYLSSHILSLHTIEESTYLRFANKFFSRQKREMSAEDFHTLYQMVDGQTLYEQSILHQLYEMAGAPLNDESIRMAVKDILGRLDVAYSNYYASLTDNQASLLVAVAREECVKSILSQDFFHVIIYQQPAA